jgi:hypothetical protein
MIEGCFLLFRGGAVLQERLAALRFVFCPCFFSSPPVFLNAAQPSPAYVPPDPLLLADPSVKALLALGRDAVNDVNGLGLQSSNRVGEPMLDLFMLLEVVSKLRVHRALFEPSRARLEAYHAAGCDAKPPPDASCALEWMCADIKANKAGNCNEHALCALAYVLRHREDVAIKAQLEAAYMMHLIRDDHAVLMLVCRDAEGVKRYVTVDCYAGYKGEEPVRVCDGRTYASYEVTPWAAPLGMNAPLPALPLAPGPGPRA